MRQVHKLVGERETGRLEGPVFKQPSRGATRWIFHLAEGGELSLEARGNDNKVKVWDMAAQLSSP